MAIPFHKAVSSLDSIQRTIENDFHTYRWFVKFISHPTIQTKLNDSHPTHNLYRTLKTIERIRMMLYLTIAIIAISALNAQHFLGLLMAPVLAAILILTRTHKKIVAKISRAILDIDREAIKLESQTLYQLSETYGRSLNIPTLVDIITRQDDIMRKTAIYACVLTCFIYPLDFWSNWFIMITAFFLIQTAINTPLVFDHLK